LEVAQSLLTHSNEVAALSRYIIPGICVAACKYGFIFLQLYFSFNCAHAIIFLDGASTSRRIGRQRSIHHKKAAQRRVGGSGGEDSLIMSACAQSDTKLTNSRRDWADWTGQGSQRFTQLGPARLSCRGASAIKTILRFPLCVGQMASCALFCMLRSLRTPPRTMQQWEQYTGNKIREC